MKTINEDRQQTDEEYEAMPAMKATTAMKSQTVGVFQKTWDDHYIDMWEARPSTWTLLKIEHDKTRGQVKETWIWDEPSVQKLRRLPRLDAEANCD